MRTENSVEERLQQIKGRLEFAHECEAPYSAPYSVEDMEFLTAALEKALGALEYYSTEQDMETPGRKEFGCGCCCWTVDEKGNADYENCAGLTAKEALAEIEKLAKGEF